jgi:hypothetical protein
MESVCESGVYQAVPARKFNKPSMWFGLRRTDQQAQAWKSESEGRSTPTVLQIHLVRRSSSTEVGSRRAHGPRDRGDHRDPQGNIARRREWRESTNARGATWKDSESRFGPQSEYDSPRLRLTAVLRITSRHQTSAPRFRCVSCCPPLSFLNRPSLQVEQSFPPAIGLSHPTFGRIQAALLSPPSTKCHADGFSNCLRQPLVAPSRSRCEIAGGAQKAIGEPSLGSRPVISICCCWCAPEHE